MMGSMPASTKGGIATGPAIVMEYSRFDDTLMSPPGNTIWSTGMGMVQFPCRGLAGFLGTGVPSGFVRVMTFELGRNATGDSDRISKPRMSFSPPMKKRWNGGATRPPYPLINDPLSV